MFSNSKHDFDIYSRQATVHEILHIKCPIIGLIRFQMNNMEHRLSESFDMCQRFELLIDFNFKPLPKLVFSFRRKKLSYKLWKNRWTIISFILLMLLMMSLFLYGTLVGAGLCSAGSWGPSYNSPCPKTFTLFPLLNVASKSSRLPF